jgi:flavin-binding protein dodecin
MSDNIYKKIELVGSSPNGIEDAVNNAIDRAAKTIRNMGWFEVAEVRGHIVDNKVAHWQVTVKVGFTLDSWFIQARNGELTTGGMYFDWTQFVRSIEPNLESILYVFSPVAPYKR